MYDALGTFAAGIFTAAGPCVAPRFAAVAALTAGRSRASAMKLAAAFCAGLLLGYASFAAAAWIFHDALQYSQSLYAALAAAFGAAALWPLLRPSCSHQVAVKPVSGAGAMLLGLCLALVVSPCCAPVIVAVMAYAAASANVPHAAVLLVCYAAGHALPLLALAGAAQKCAAVFTALATARTSVLVSSGVLLALGAYYAVLA